MIDHQIYNDPYPQYDIKAPESPVFINKVGCGDQVLLPLQLARISELFRDV